ncbi:hypothetical protein GOP47_0003708 [Adiantum capillus-veneris]|uniref:DUF2470 domain-containing protein n=1 Tax=Adiantum capillus-veneris TaxID=13818 RepID=A0A9D4V6T4_ADICA|nr:hypothetical protein GOP47_0003708 [Adiantum capillus-veneris]
MVVAVFPHGLIGVPLARRVLFREPNSVSSFYQHLVFSRAPSRALSRRLAAIAMTTAAPDAASPSMITSEKEELEFWQRVTAHQKTAQRLSASEEARIVVDQCLSAFLSTFSKKFEGFPYTSYVDYAADEDGSLILSVSSLAPHRKDLEEYQKCSLLIMKDKLDRSDILVTYMGEASEVPELEVKKARDVFLSKHPQAFWVDFGDFKFMRVQPRMIRYASGIVSPFNRTGEFSGEDLTHANLDPIAQFSIPIVTHMNKDHADDTKRIVEKAIGINVESARIIDLDTLGLNVQVVFQSKPIKLRVPFPRPAQDRKDVKNLIVQMLKG